MQVKIFCRRRDVVLRDDIPLEEVNSTSLSGQKRRFVEQSSDSVHAEHVLYVTLASQLLLGQLKLLVAVNQVFATTWLATATHEAAA